MKTIIDYNYKFQDPDNWVTDPLFHLLDTMSGQANTGPAYASTERVSESTLVVVRTTSSAVAISDSEYQGDPIIEIQNGIPILKRKQILEVTHKKEGAEYDQKDYNSLVLGPDTVIAGFLIGHDMISGFDEVPKDFYTVSALASKNIILEAFNLSLANVNVKETSTYERLQIPTFLKIGSKRVGYVMVDPLDNGVTELLLFSFSLSSDLLTISSYDAGVNEWVPDEMEESFFNDFANNIQQKMEQYVKEAVSNYNPPEYHDEGLHMAQKEEDKQRKELKERQDALRREADQQLAILEPQRATAQKEILQIHSQQEELNNEMIAAVKRGQVDIIPEKESAHNRLAEQLDILQRKEAEILSKIEALSASISDE